eukprot:1007521_1
MSESVDHQTDGNEQKEPHLPPPPPPLEPITRQFQTNAHSLLFKCQKCPKTYASESRLKRHLMYHLDISERPHKCDWCIWSFVQHSELTRHQKRKHPSKTIGLEPSAINYRTNCTEDRTMAMTEEETDVETKQNMIDDTNRKKKVFKSKRLNEKTRYCYNKFYCDDAIEYEFQCKFCKNLFQKKQHLIDHERIHTKAKPFTCKYCMKGFDVKSKWGKHEASHTF